MRQRRLKRFGDEASEQGDIVRHLVGDDDDVGAEIGAPEIRAGDELQDPIAGRGDQRLKGLISKRSVRIHDGQRAIDGPDARSLIGGLRPYHPGARVRQMSGHGEERAPHLLPGDHVTHRELDRTEAAAPPADQGPE